MNRETRIVQVCLEELINFWLHGNKAFVDSGLVFGDHIQSCPLVRVGFVVGEGAQP